MRNIPFGRPIIMDEEKNAVFEVLSGHILTHGPKVKEFENQFSSFIGGKNSLAVASCTASLHLAYFYLGLGPGDEVIVPAQTHAATGHSVEFCGAKPVFVDCELNTGNINIDLIEDAITERTKAISVVHFLGITVKMDLITSIAKKYNLFVVEDCALAIGSYFKDIHAGLHGDVGCFSFYPVKHMTTAEGGMFVTKHSDIAKTVSKQRAFGLDKQLSERKIPGVYDIDMLGFNYRMSEIQAAIGVEQLKRVGSFLEKRSDNFQYLANKLKEVEKIQIIESDDKTCKSSYYCLSVILKEDLSKRRVEIINKLKENGIGTSIYYPRPVPLMKYYRQKYGYTNDMFPNASVISNSSIALPVGPHLGIEDMEYISEEFRKIL